MDTRELSDEHRHEISSRGLFTEQENESLTRKLTEEEQQNAPLISLADKRQLKNVGPALDAHEQRLRDFRGRVRALLPPEREERQSLGSLQRGSLQDPLTEDYISITSGHSIVSMKEDLFNLWKYQRYNRKDSPDMRHLKNVLTDLTDRFEEEVSFSSREDVRQHSIVMEEKYRALILSCETYLRNHKRPWSIAGKARKSMAERLLKAARTEADIVMDSALNSFEEIRELEAGTGRVSLSWDRILHNGRIRNIHTGNGPVTLNRHGLSNATEIIDETTGKREILTFARNSGELKKCRRIVAMSRLASRLGCGDLAGAGKMTTRMTTMVINGKTVMGCITSGLTRTSRSVFNYENDRNQRPGADVLEQVRPAYTAEHLQDVLMLPFLDYLCGNSRPAHKDFPCEKKQSSRKLELGRIQETGHLLADEGFKTEVRPPMNLQNVWMDPELADQILSLKAEDISGLLADVLEQGERQAVIARLIQLQGSIREAAGPEGCVRNEQGVERLDRVRMPSSFKDKDALAEMLRDHPERLTAYAQSQGETGVHKHLSEEFAANSEGAVEAKVSGKGLLMPLNILAGEIKEPEGPMAAELKGYVSGFVAGINAFNEARTGAVPFDEGEDAVLEQVDVQLRPLTIVRENCRQYLAGSWAKEDLANRLAVGKLLQAVDHQVGKYREHVEGMCRWAGTMRNIRSDRELSFTFEELFNEAMLIADRTWSGEGAFSIDALYQDVLLSDEQLCRKTETESITSLAQQLHSNLVYRSSQGGNNSEQVQEFERKLQEAKAALSFPAQDQAADFVERINELMTACGQYVEKQESHLFKGKLSSDGKERMRLADELQDLLEEEYSAFLKKNEDGSFSLDQAGLSRLIDSCATEELPRERVSFRDISLQIKRGILVQREKALSAGTDMGIRERRLERERRRTALAEAEKEKAKKKAQRPPRTSMDQDFVQLEAELSAQLKIGGLNELSRQIDDSIADREENSPQILAFAEKLGNLIKLKNAPLFSSRQAAYYTEQLRNGADPKGLMHNDAVGVYNRMAELMNELTAAHDDYLNKQNSRLFGGTIRGQERMDIVGEAYRTCRWEFASFQKEREGGERSFDSRNLMRKLMSLINSGKPLGEITMTDLTNMSRMDELAKREKEEIRARSSVQKDSGAPAPQQPEAVSTEARDAEALQQEGSGEAVSAFVPSPELTTLYRDLDALKGHKFGNREDSIEFQSVLTGLKTLLDLTKTADEKTLRAYYGDVIGKCQTYEGKSSVSSRSKRRKLVSQIRILCEDERNKLGTAGA